VTVDRTSPLQPVIGASESPTLPESPSISVARSLRGRKLGLLISCSPDQAAFGHGLGVARAALEAGVDVYLYLIDDAVAGVCMEGVQSLRDRGLKLYACAYGAQRRGIPINDRAVFAGLTVVSDLIASTDRFMAFNGGHA
jgi:predicted peroxiredoxin